MKKYEVTLMATSYKTVNVCADSEKDAENMVDDIYCCTDALNFGASDVEEVMVDVNEAEDFDDDDAEDEETDEDEDEPDEEKNSDPEKNQNVLLQFVKCIRDSTLSDDEIASIMKEHLEKDQAKGKAK
jgi:hypothetical protein